ncbi:hypothetical protein FS749_007081 [Ceratobasidium sp. UAMH 11750]|nr:hypothetical protein FS749_007081 [Ceratobasidium sp. UAMH 11750]
MRKRVSTPLLLRLHSHAPLSLAHSHTSAPGLVRLRSFHARSALIVSHAWRFGSRPAAPLVRLSPCPDIHIASTSANGNASATLTMSTSPLTASRNTVVPRSRIRMLGQSRHWRGIALPLSPVALQLRSPAPVYSPARACRAPPFHDFVPMFFVTPAHARRTDL